MEDCPERLKPSLQRLFDSMNEAVVWITRRTSLHHRINQLRKGLLEGSCGPREEINRIELEVLENRLSAVVKALERSKANVRQVEEAHTDEILEYRVESFPPEGRDGARRFLLELRDKSLKLREAYDDRRGTLDALQSAVLNLEREIKEAQDHGNEELARSLSMRMATVKAERSQAEEALRDATAKRIRANETYDENVIEYRADTFPPELREKAHAILLEQRHKIAEVHEPHRDLSTMWSNAQLALLKLQREMEVAQDRGDDGLARSLSQQIESMKIEKAVGEEALRQIRIREQEIETEYARKLETLGS
ncbi:MAG TPA: hypothetical protein VG944_10105 [Fimbriimonas sp.]|nr:hypothetical protein [Fimbriimonas sp.]